MMMSVLTFEGGDNLMGVILLVEHTESTKYSNPFIHRDVHTSCTRLCEFVNNSEGDVNNLVRLK